MGFYTDNIFPIMLDTLTAGLRAQRQEIIRTASGRVLELGIGTGANLEFYTTEVSKVVGIEPSAALLDKTRARLQRLQGQSALRPTVELQQASAEQMSFADAQFDTVVACLVFCTIPAADAAIREVYRVLKPGGKVVFFEHVRASGARVSKWQDRLNPLWNKLACGCNLNRDTKTLFASTGLVFENIREYYHPALRFLKFASFMIQGVALKPKSSTS